MTRFALCFVVFFAAAYTAFGESASTPSEAACRSRLEAIRDAIRASQTDTGDLPSWLSDLVPKYLADPLALLCPADEKQGDPVHVDGKDPKLPSSYLYEFHPVWRAEKNAERRIYGERTPLVRCLHHDPVLNLTCDGTIHAFSNWQEEPLVIEALVANFRAAIASGVADAEAKRGTIVYADVVMWFAVKARDWLVNEAKSAVASNPANGTAQKILAVCAMMDGWDARTIAEMEAASRLLPNDVEIAYCLGMLYRKASRPNDAVAAYEKTRSLLDGTTRPFWNNYPRLSGVNRELAGLYAETNRQEDADAIVEEFEASSDPEDANSLIAVGDLLLMTRHPERALAVFEKALPMSPDNGYLFGQLAQAHSALGHAALAQEFRLKSDPGIGLIGKPAPDFVGADRNGSRIALADYAGKVVILTYGASW